MMRAFQPPPKPPFGEIRARPRRKLFFILIGLASLVLFALGMMVAPFRLPTL
jgi:hypothetical protein